MSFNFCLFRKVPFLSGAKTLLKRKFPKLYRKLHYFYFVSRAGYQDFHLQNKTIRFWLATCRDRRGIGRVSRDILQYLEKKQIKGNDNADVVINFFPSVFFCPKNLPKNSIILVHDVMPLACPDAFSKEVVDLWRSDYIGIIKQARKIITISNSSASDIVRYSGVSRSNVEVVPLGIGSINRTINCKSECSRFKEIFSNYIVFLGSTDKHKNLAVIFSALMDKSLSDINLVIIGDSSNIKDEIPLSIKSRVYLLGRLADEDVVGILKHALALVFPSLHEGMGLPPFEAAYLRCQLILSNAPAMNEYWRGGECYFVDPLCVEGWVDAINKSRVQNVQMIDKAYDKAVKYINSSANEQLIELILK